MKIIAVPRIETGSVIITGVNIPVCLATVYRYEDSGNIVILRGAQDMYVTTGGFIVEDSEAPYNVELRYVTLINVDQASARIIQTNLITNPSFEKDLTSWTTGQYRDMTRLTLQSAGGNTGSSAPFDIRTITPTMTPSLGALRPNDPMVDLLRDPTTNQWYVSQSTAGTLANTRSMVVSRLTADGVLIDSMTLTDAATVGDIPLMGMQVISGAVWLYLQWPTVNVTTGIITTNDLGRMRYSTGIKTKSALTAVDWVLTNDFTTNYDHAKLDTVDDWIVIRVLSGTAPNRTETYIRRKLSDVTNNVNVVYGQIGPFNIDVANPAGDGQQVRGFAMHGSVLYRYTGTDNTPNNLISVYTFPATGGLTGAAAFNYSMDVSNLGATYDNTFSGGEQYPNGLSIYRPSSKEIILVIGVTTGASTARSHRGYMYTQPPTPPTSNVGNSAWVGANVMMVDDRTRQGGEVAGSVYEAPLARVNAPFASSTKDKSYEFSFRLRLHDDPLAYDFNSTVVVGTDPVLWADVYNTYPSWGLPYAQNMSWDAFSKAIIPGISNEWFTINYDQETADWRAEDGTWDGTTGTFLVDPGVTAQTAVNYVTNPAFNVNVSGYTAGVNGGGTVPTFVREAMTEAVGWAMIITPDMATAGGFVSFSVSGLTIGTQYRAWSSVKATNGATFQFSTPDNAYQSLGVIGDEFEDLTSDFMLFTASASTMTIQMRVAGGAVGVTQIMVSVPDASYFDGTTPDGSGYFYSWTGAANSSTSVRLPYGTFYSPMEDNYDEYQSGWSLARLDANPLEVAIGIVSADGDELVTPRREVVTNATTGDPGFAGVTFGSLNQTVAGYITLMLASVDQTNWEPGWRTYIQVAGIGARLHLQSRYHIYQLPSFVPYHIGIKARVLNPSGTVILTSNNLGYVTVINWTEARWSFTLPATVAGTYRIELVPELGLPAMQTSWEVDGVMLEYLPGQEGRLVYLDGTTPKPKEPLAGWMLPADVGIYDTASSDSIIEWTGVEHASSSVWKAASLVTIVVTSLLPTPNIVPEMAELMPECEPINLTDPTVPALSSWFTLQSISELTHAERSESFQVIGRRSPVVISQVRNSEAGTIALILQTLDERQRLVSLLASGRVLLLRNPDASYPENDWYLAIGNATEARISGDHRRSQRRFTFDFVVVDRPMGLIARAHDTNWEEVGAAYTSWGSAIAPRSVLANAKSWQELMSEKPAFEDPMAGNGGYKP